MASNLGITLTIDAVLGAGFAGAFSKVSGNMDALGKKASEANQKVAALGNALNLKSSLDDLQKKSIQKD